MDLFFFFSFFVFFSFISVFFPFLFFFHRPVWKENEGWGQREEKDNIRDSTRGPVAFGPWPCLPSWGWRAREVGMLGDGEAEIEADAGEDEVDLSRG